MIVNGILLKKSASRFFINIFLWVMCEYLCVDNLTMWISPSFWNFEVEKPVYKLCTAC